MKKILLAALFVAAFMSQSSFAQSITKNLGTDCYPTVGTQPAQCRLYKGPAVVVTTPAIACASQQGAKTCFFPSMSLSAGDSFTATAIDINGFESAQSVPFVLPAAPIAPAGLRVVQ